MYYLLINLEWISLNNLIDEDVTEAEIIDEKSDFVLVSYSNWDSMELCAILNKEGTVIYKDFYSLENYNQMKSVD